jgi:hypothetical protein
MKIQIDGFDIEIDTTDDQMAIKVIDANGKELSNNTYSQSLDLTDDIEDVDVPAVEEVEDENIEDETEDEELTDELEDEEETTEEDDTELEDLEDDLEDLGESFMTFEQYKKRNRKATK